MDPFQRFLCEAGRTTGPASILAATLADRSQCPSGEAVSPKTTPVADGRESPALAFVNVSACSDEYLETADADAKDADGAC